MVTVDIMQIVMVLRLVRLLDGPYPERIAIQKICKVSICKLIGEDCLVALPDEIFKTIGTYSVLMVLDVVDYSDDVSDMNDRSQTRLVDSELRPYANRVTECLDS